MSSLLRRLKSPVTLTVGADIPSGSAITIVLLTPVGPKRFPFTSSAGSHTVTFPIQGVAVELHLPPSPTLGTPFLEFIHFEARTDFNRVSAQSLFNDQPGLVLCRPSSGNPYIALSMLGSDFMERSAVARPWHVKIVGDAPKDSSIELHLRGSTASGDEWSCNLDGQFMRDIEPVTLASLGVEVRLRASSDGYASPSLEGVSIEGDERSIFIPVHRLLSKGIPPEFQLIHTDDISVLMLRPILPKFFEAPSVIDRIQKLEQEGKLRPQVID